LPPEQREAIDLDIIIPVVEQSGHRTGASPPGDAVAAMNSDADDLLLFARVIEAGSFSRAAERVGLPKSTVSRRLAALEKRLGERLLLRTTRKLSITDFGQGVLDHARALATEVEGALALALSRQARPSGRLRVTMPGDFASVALEKPLADFVAQYPDIALEVDLSPRRVDLIGENFDLAIRMGTLTDDAQLAARPVAHFTTGLYAAPSLVARHGEPMTPDALHALPALMILTRAGDPAAWALTPHRPAAAGEGAAMAPMETGPGSPASVARRAADAAYDPERRVVMPERRTLANSPEFLIRLARNGAGIAAVSDFFAEPYVRRGELRRVLPGWDLPVTTAWAVFPGRRLLPSRTRLFIEMMVAALAPCAEAAARCAEASAQAGAHAPPTIDALLSGTTSGAPARSAVAAEGLPASD
jgi:DNA-binding transcriptional LysR family regulator